VETDKTIETDLRQKLVTWLKKRDWTTDELFRWLEGKELPGVGYDEEPYEWILRALPIADERHEAEQELARRLSLVLRHEPDAKSGITYSNEALYNLLSLSAELQCRDVLAEPLYQMYERRALTGEWRGVSLREPLAAALIYNQVDNRLAPLWERMLEQGDEFLPGDEQSAFAGILYMPSSAQTRGEPYLGCIGKALGRIATQLEKEKNGQAQFLRLLGWVKSAYPRTEHRWAIDLIKQADENNWTAWAIVRLDLVCELDRGQSQALDVYEYYIWDAYFPFLYQVCRSASGHGKHHVTKKQSLCQGKVLRVLVSGDTQELLMALTFNAEMERRKAAGEFSSYDTVYKITCATFYDTAYTYLENSKSHKEEADSIVLACRNAGMDSLARVYPQAAPKLKAMAARLGDGG
jgi:hypothetical protein